VCFDFQTQLTRSEFMQEYPEYFELCELLKNALPFDYEKFQGLPGWTMEKCAALHKKHIAAIKGATK
jgi:hypothetical protein